MDIIVSLLGALVSLVLVSGVVFLVYLAIYYYQSLANQAPVNPNPEAKTDGMNEGDFHSGPEGYSPGTAYPETFYGSSGEIDDHDEGDFNR